MVTDVIASASAVVLAGGKSSRMGRPKSLLLFAGEPLIVHIVRALQQMFAETVVVAAPEQDLPDLPARLVRDEIPHQGPVGGIYYGLRAASGSVCFVTSCDAPFLNPSLISYLVSRISAYDVVVPHWEDRFQPLHAAYRTSVSPLLKEQLDRGELRPVHLFERVRTCKIGEDEIRRFDPEGLSFLNMNTPDDYQRALQRWDEVNEPVRCTRREDAEAPERARELESLVEKLLRARGKAAKGKAEPPTEARDSEDIRSLLLAAVESHTPMEIEYDGFQGVTHRVVEPSSFDGRYLSGFCRLRQDQRVFNTARILSAKLVS